MRRRGHRLALVLALVAAGCAPSPADSGGGAASTASGIEVDSAPCTADPVLSTPGAVAASGLDWIFGESLPASFPEPLLAGSQIVPVLRPDGIPAVDQPRCLPIEGVGFLEDNAPVIAIEIDGDARAYPLEIMTWHELVNDTVGGEPITISYCPLCNSAIAYDRRVGDRVLDFGTSGALSQSSMVMYDRQTETLWTHFDGRAVVGELTGERLGFHSTSIVSWADFRSQFPEGLVLSRDTGFDRDYGRNPYPGYEENDDPIRQFITDDIDPRLDPMVRVVGVEVDEDAVAVVHRPLYEAGVVSFTLGGRPLVAWNLPGTASALEGTLVSGGVDVGATSVFVASVDGEVLTFERESGSFVDDETGSRWSIFGEAIDGPLEGTRLEMVPHVDTFWFAWGSFFDGTDIVG